MNRLASKVAVITGGAVGLGRATAVRMAEEGAAVAVLDVRDEEGLELVAELTQRGLSAGWWRCNVASEAEVQSALDAVVARFGKLDILVNNAGIAGVNKPTHEITEGAVYLASDEAGFVTGAELVIDGGYTAR